MKAVRAIRRPRCRHCSRILHWDPTHAHPRSNRAWQRAENNTAIRCLWCGETFCRKCAKKHFAPIQRVQRQVESLLEGVALKAMREVVKKFPRVVAHFKGGKWK